MRIPGALSRHHAAAALLLSAVVIAAGWRWNTRVAAGSDAYGYVSQADLWLRGNLFIDQSFAAAAPWPIPRWTFTPLGYRPEPSGYRIVPAYAPGLSMFMAAAKALFGPCALFAIVPIAGGVLVLSTYGIGRRIERPIVGLAAAWIVSTSATMLFMLMAPMSDVPAAAAWTLAIAFALGETTLNAAAAGAASAAAILIRPNLAPLAAVIGIWLFWQVTASRLMWRAVVAYALLTSVGAGAMGIINRSLYGSPFASGYGDLSDAFDIAFVMPNIRGYLWWLLTAESPLAFAGLLCMYVPKRVLWTTDASRRAVALLSAAAAVVWVLYLLYLPSEAWWFLRFLLPAWPGMAIGAASLIAFIWHRSFALGRVISILALAAIGMFGLAQAYARSAFDMAAGEAKYVEVANAVSAATDSQDVIIAAQHSGSIRYYGGRLTMRWDNLDPAWLDRAVAWLSARGHHPYVVLERQELAEFRARFRASSKLGQLAWPPTIDFRGGDIQMFDLTVSEPQTRTVEQPGRGAVHSCREPRSTPGL